MKRKEKAKILADILEYQRLSKGMTQQELANFLGISRSSLTYYLLGERFPNPAKIKEMSKKLNIDIAKKIIYEER